MDRIEMVEKLREKTGVTYEEAKSALESSDWDLLDAVVMLEKEGKVKDAAYSTKRPETEEEQRTGKKAKKEKSDGFEKFMSFVGRIIHKGNTNHLLIQRNGEKKFSLPVTALVLILLFLPYVAIPLIIVSLFFGFHYKFAGPELGKEKINNAMAKATAAAEAVKEEFKEETKEDAQRVKEDLKRTKDEIKKEFKDLVEHFEEALEELEEELDEIEAELEESEEDKK